MNIDITKSPEENLFALILATNPSTPLTGPLDYTHGDPIEHDADVGNRNAGIILSGVVARGFDGDIGVNYRRLSLTQGIAVPTLSYNADQGTNVYADETALLTAIAAGLGVRLDQLAFTTPGALLTRPSDSAGAKTIQVQPIANSLLYADVALNITLNFNLLLVDIAAELPNHDLDGFFAATA